MKEVFKNNQDAVFVLRRNARHRNADRPFPSQTQADAYAKMATCRRIRMPKECLGEDLN